jgi:hypothetical protein
MSYDIAKDSETQDPHFEQKQQSQNEVPCSNQLRFSPQPAFFFFILCYSNSPKDTVPTDHQ